MDTLPLDIGLHVSIAQYLSIDDLSVYVNTFNLDTSQFWNTLVYIRFPKSRYTINKLCIGSYKYIDIYKTIEYILSMYPYKLSVYKRYCYCLQYTMDHLKLKGFVLTLLERGSYFLDLYPEYKMVCMYAVGTLIPYLFTLDLYTGLEYLIISNQYILNTEELNYVISRNFSSELNEYILDHYNIPFDTLSSILISSIYKNIELCDLIFSKIKPEDHDQLLEEVYDNLMYMLNNKVIITPKQFDCMYKLLHPTYIASMLDAFEMIPETDRELLKYIFDLLPEDIPSEILLDTMTHLKDAGEDEKLNMLKEKYHV